MTYLRVGDVRSAFRTSSARAASTKASAATALVASGAPTSASSYDIFLSHSIQDVDLVVGVKTILEREGSTVYVDWMDAPLRDRTAVTRNTAASLRQRMNQSKTLVYLWTSNAGLSRWMQWELGYFDGRSGGRVAVLPVVVSTDEEYSAVEFVGLYPVLERFGGSTNALVGTSASPGKYYKVANTRFGSG